MTIILIDIYHFSGPSKWKVMKIFTPVIRYCYNLCLLLVIIGCCSRTHPLYNIKFIQGFFFFQQHAWIPIIIIWSCNHQEEIECNLSLYTMYLFRFCKLIVIFGIKISSNWFLVITCYSTCNKMPQICLYVSPKVWHKTTQDAAVLKL